MTLGIMQPYFFPYIGYFQLFNVVDAFVVYDNIEFTKKGWINRNRHLQNGIDAMFTLPLQKDSDFLDIRERRLAESFPEEKEKIKRRVQAAYAKAPYFDQAFPVFADCLDFADHNLFNFIFHSLQKLQQYLSIDTRTIISSEVKEPEGLKGQERVIAICQKLGATQYINTIGGTDLYDKRAFEDQGIKLSFIKAKPIEYPQFGGDFVPSLSILDVMMFNSPQQITELLDRYELV